MNIDTLNILADAISDVGAWNWWYIDDKLVQMEFRDIMLYDESKSCSTDVLAVRFKSHPFAAFLDNLHDDTWYERFRDNDSIIYPFDTYYLAFDDVNEAKKVMTDYRNIRPTKDFEGPETLSCAKHLVSAGCGEVGFIAGGDEIEIVGEKGKYTEKEIEAACGKWWEYWRDYWRKRGTKAAYPKDYVCEASIPVSEG